MTKSICLSYVVLLVSVTGCISNSGPEGSTNPRTMGTPPGGGQLVTVQPNPAPPKAYPPLTGSSATLIVHGLACPSCAKGVLRELKQLDGMRSVELDPVEGTATIEFDPAKPPATQDIQNAVRWGGAVLIDIQQP